MSKPILLITGATGNQGGSTAHTILDSPNLSQKYTVRAASRDITNPKFLALQAKGAELVQADLEDPSSLPSALKDVTYAFLITTTTYDGKSRETETRQAKAFCTEAVKQGVQYIIWSSMSHPAKLSGGKYVNVEYFDDKAEIEEYIRTLPVKSAFYAPGSFMQNFLTQLKPKPSRENDGTYTISGVLKPDSLVPYVDITDTGKWIGAILSDPEKYEGKFFAAANKLVTHTECADMISRHTGKTVRYQQVPDEVYKGFLPEVMRECIFEMWAFIRDFGYFGAEQEKLVNWTREQALSEPTSFEKWLVKVDYKVE